VTEARAQSARITRTGLHCSDEHPHGRVPSRGSAFSDVARCDLPDGFAFGRERAAADRSRALNTNWSSPARNASTFSAQSAEPRPGRSVELANR
jgi:hypothetical protein